MSDSKKVKSKGSTAEIAEPTVKKDRGPVLIFVILGLLLYLGMGFLAEHAGGFNSSVYEPYSSYKVVEYIQPGNSGPDPVKDGKKVYEGKGCIACHQGSGMGVPGQFPPLAGSDWVNAEGSERLVRIVLHGVAGPINVSGQSFNGAMPPWKGVLTDKEIADALSYIRNAWGNKGTIVTEEEVKAISDKEGARANPWAPTDLLALPAAPAKK